MLHAVYPLFSYFSFLNVLHKKHSTNFPEVYLFFIVQIPRTLLFKVFYYDLERILLCLPGLHLFEIKKYSKNSNIVKYYYKWI